MRVIKDLDLVEHRGSGIPRITQFFSPDSFHFTDNFLRLRFPAIEPVHTESEVEAPVTQDVMEPESRPESRPESELAIRILTFLHTENKSKADLALSLGHKTISGELNNQIRALLAADFIERALPDKPNSACNDIG